MELPWKGHIDAHSRQSVKIKVRETPKKDENAKIDRLGTTMTSIRSKTSLKLSPSKTKLNPKGEPLTIKEEAEIQVHSVQPHNDYQPDPLIESLRKEKELERKQKVLQMAKLKEIQEEEEQQRKQVKKLQTEMKSKPFV